MCSASLVASACNSGDMGLIPGFGRSPGEGNGNSLQYSCPEKPMDGGGWQATVHGVAESDTTERPHSLTHASHKLSFSLNLRFLMYKTDITEPSS